MTGNSYNCVSIEERNLEKNTEYFHMTPSENVKLLSIRFGGGQKYSALKKRL